MLDCATCGSCAGDASCFCCCCASEECGDCDLPCDMDCGILDACCESADCLEICMECCSLCFSSWGPKPSPEWGRGRAKYLSACLTCIHCRKFRNNFDQCRNRAERPYGQSLLPGLCGLHYIGWPSWIHNMANVTYRLWQVKDVT